MAKPVRVAVIGAGNMGKNHIRNYSNMPEADLVGVADSNPAAKSVAKEFGVAYFADYKKMLTTLKPDAVSIVVPTPLHAEIGLFAMNLGIHCLVEKPIASTIKEAEALIKKAKAKNLVFTVGHIERYNPLIRRLVKLIKQDKVGTITSILCRRVGGFPAVEPKTDVIIDLAVHDIDIMNFLMGAYPNNVYSHGSRTLHSSKVDSAKILLDYGNASGFVYANWLTPIKVRTITVTGTKGMVEGNYITQRLTWYENNMKRVNNGFESFVATMGDPQQTEIKVTFEEPLGLELSAFLARVAGKKSGADLVDPDDAKEALRIALHSVRDYEK